MKVLVPIETAARELLYKTYLGQALASRGLTVFLGTKGLIGALVATERQYIYVDKGFHPGYSESLFATVRQRGGVLVNLDEEGAVDFPDGSTLRHRYAPALFEASSRVFLWGRAQHEQVRAFARDPRQVVVTGHPRFHLLKPPFHGMYVEDAAAITHRFGRFVLVNTNMGFGNNLRGDVFVTANYRSRFPFVERLIAFDRNKLDTIVAFVHALACNGDRTVVIRPHPEEDPDTYRRACMGLANVHVCFEGSVIPWILASDAVVHPDCTTAIEAVMVGRPAISLLPADADAELVASLPCQVSLRAKNPQDALACLAAATAGAGPAAEAAGVLERYFAFQRDPVGLIVEEVAALASGHGASTRLSVSGVMALSRRTAHARWHGPTGDRLVANKLRGFHRAAVAGAAARAAAVQPEFRSVRVRQIVPGLFRFSDPSASRRARPA